MIKKIVQQDEHIPFSLYLIEKDGKPIIVSKTHLIRGLDFERAEEVARPAFEVVELEDAPDNAELKSFVASVLAGDHADHELSYNFRIMRSLERQRQCEEAMNEQKMKRKY